MICPKCRSEYREGYARCADCDVDLVQPEPVSTEPEVALVKVYETGNPAVIPLLESLFNDAKIQYMAKGEAIQDLFGWGRFGTGLNYVIGPVQFYVREDEAEDARRILETLKLPVPPIADGDSESG
jgi:hypothetical protein